MLDGGLSNLDMLWENQSRTRHLRVWWLKLADYGVDRDSKGVLSFDFKPSFTGSDSIAVAIGWPCQPHMDGILRYLPATKNRFCACEAFSAEVIRKVAGDVPTDCFQLHNSSGLCLSLNISLNTSATRSCGTSVTRHLCTTV